MADPKPVYLISNYMVTDPESMARYVQEAGPIVRKFGGRLIALDQNVTKIEGSAEAGLVIIEYPDLETAKAFYDAPEYTAIEHLRTDATAGGFLIFAESFSPG